VDDLRLIFLWGSDQMPGRIGVADQALLARPEPLRVSAHPGDDPLRAPAA
jgi:hypothetical protein